MKNRSELETLRVRVETYGHPPGELDCQARRYDRAERTARAAWVAGALLLGAVLSAPFPVWHVLAVPGFLIAAVRLGRGRLRQELSIEAVSGPCPACGEKHSYAMQASDTFPHTTACPGCRAFLKLVEVR